MEPTLRHLATRASALYTRIIYSLVARTLCQWYRQYGEQLLRSGHRCIGTPCAAQYGEPQHGGRAEVQGYESSGQNCDYALTLYRDREAQIHVKLKTVARR